MDDVRVFRDIGGERRIGSRQLHDAQRRRVQYALAGGAVDLHALERAVGLDRHGDYEGAVDPLIARGLRVVELPYPLDLGAPVLDVAGKAVLLGARPDEAPPRPLLVVLPFPGNLRFQPRDFEPAGNDIRCIRGDLLDRKSTRLNSSH